MLVLMSIVLCLSHKCEPGLTNDFHRCENFQNSQARWKTRGRGSGMRGPGVRGSRGVETRGLVENAGSGGKRGIWWKTRGLMWKTRGTTIFRQNMHFPH